ncbi:uncharacterized protein LOC112228712 isoform X2 [Oncorhynchus tshawytscha]|uniref:uncharacterized protein LOC112228712 isoform X2 n=1 Tax=Oncorhynchus tshawytscha TaxID=74940 RepID=UPI000D09C35D|nr:uncharacterized protein LOC112228712 isoform X2 [Oncorhynchus tshawytscha]
MEVLQQRRALQETPGRSTPVVTVSPPMVLPRARPRPETPAVEASPTVHTAADPGEPAVQPCGGPAPQGPPPNNTWRSSRRLPSMRRRSGQSGIQASAAFSGPETSRGHCLLSRSRRALSRHPLFLQPPLPGLKHALTMSSCPTAAWTPHCTLRAPRTTSTHAERTEEQGAPSWEGPEEGSLSIPEEKEEEDDKIEDDEEDKDGGREHSPSPKRSTGDGEGSGVSDGPPTPFSGEMENPLQPCPNPSSDPRVCQKHLPHCQWGEGHTLDKGC